MAAPALVWFRDDHRVADNPALAAAVASGRPLLCCYVFDEESPGLRPLGGAARWWLHGSLAALDANLRRLGGELCLLRGAGAPTIAAAVAASGAAAVFCNRRYVAAEAAVDRAVAAELERRGVAFETFNARLLHEPHEVRTKTGGTYRVFTPYLRAARALGAPSRPLPPPKRLAAASPASLEPWRASLDSLALEPRRPNWAAEMARVFERGESAARARLAAFVDEGLAGYGLARDRPGLSGTSLLSPHLRFGEIGPRQVYHAVTAAVSAGRGGVPEKDAEKLLAEMLWRDFAYALLVEDPDLAVRSADPRFARFPWRRSAADLGAWQEGRTGYPIVDAGMRQLWRTGFMHNRVRMIVASFLIKHLLIDWRAGERWFWDTLCDADPANNAFNWQWVAGSGPDAAPFFRVFNPITQGEKFDPDGAYVRAYVPEIAALPDRCLHRPFDAPADTLEAAGIVLGRTYPKPLVAHEAGRHRALEAWQGSRRPS